MSPATAVAEKPPTMTDVRRQEEALADLRTNAAELAEKEESLAGEIAEALADGEDAAELQRERRGARELLDDLEAAEGVLEDRIEVTRQAARRELARETAKADQKAVGGSAGEAPREAERILEAWAKLKPMMERAMTRQFEASARRNRCRWLAERFGIEVPELKNIPGDGIEAVMRVKREVRTISSPPDYILLADHKKRGPKAVKALASMFDAPTPEELTADDSGEA